MYFIGDNWFEQDSISQLLEQRQYSFTQLYPSLVTYISAVEERTVRFSIILQYSLSFGQSVKRNIRKEIGHLAVGIAYLAFLVISIGEEGVRPSPAQDNGLDEEQSGGV